MVRAYIRKHAWQEGECCTSIGTIQYHRSSGISSSIILHIFLQGPVIMANPRGPPMVLHTFDIPPASCVCSAVLMRSTRKGSFGSFANRWPLYKSRWGQVESVWSTQGTPQIRLADNTGRLADRNWVVVHSYSSKWEGIRSDLKASRTRHSFRFAQTSLMDAANSATSKCNPPTIHILETPVTADGTAQISYYNPNELHQSQISSACRSRLWPSAGGNFPRNPWFKGVGCLPFK